MLLFSNILIKFSKILYKFYINFQAEIYILNQIRENLSWIERNQHKLSKYTVTSQIKNSSQLNAMIIYFTSKYNEHILIIMIRVP